MNYGRFAGLKNGGVDFVTPLKDNAKHEVVEQVHDFVHEQPDGKDVRVTDEYALVKEIVGSDHVVSASL